MLNIDHDRDRRLSTILKKNFSDFEAKLGKRNEMQNAEACGKCRS
jgi:hypothetical protein